uniref:Putative methyltransferase n=1 Tax=viral metagenome TaxID=1070528 RepID=A0A6M3LCQ3_9ZZZZ
MAESIVFNEDCQIGMAKFPNKYFDLAVCDIPYGINVGKMPYLTEMNTTVKQKNGTRLSGNKNKKPYKQKEWDEQVPDQKYFDELCRISKDQIIFGIEYTDWKGIGNGRIKWDKGVAEGMSFNRYEVAYCSLINEEIELPLLWAGMCQAKSLSEPMTQQGNKKLNEKRIHPTHKPIMLYDLIYKRFSRKGMKIIDTHLGGGSNRISADKNELDFVAFEIDKDYFDASAKRFENYKSQLKLF